MYLKVLWNIPNFYNDEIFVFEAIFIWLAERGHLIMFEVMSSASL